MQLVPGGALWWFLMFLFNNSNVHFACYPVDSLVLHEMVYKKYYLQTPTSSAEGNVLASYGGDTAKIAASILVYSNTTKLQQS